jgi:DNA polymerase III subunit delta'
VKKTKTKENEIDLPLPLQPELLEAHPGIPDALSKWKESGRVPPVLLLTGPRGCGKRAIAFYLAQTLQCERAGFFTAPVDEEESLFGGGSEASFGFDVKPEAPQGKGPCGECAACRRALLGQSLDFTEITVEKDAKTLGVDQFREIKEKQGFAGYGGGARIFLITDADRMTIAAANSVLKLLEEPPEGWIFLLSVADPSLLPSTVVSRCQMLRLRPLTENVLGALLAKEEVAADRIRTVTKIAEGSITRALELSSDDAWETRGKILQFLGQPATTYHALIDYAAGDPAHFRLLLDQFEQLLTDLIRTRRTPGSTYRNIDAGRTLDDHAGKCTKRKGGEDQALRFWIAQSERLFRLRREMTAPLNAKVLAQDFLSPWMDAV